jgi:hypothetical protein
MKTMKKYLLLFIVIVMVSCGGSAEAPKYGIAKDPSIIDSLPTDSVKQPVDSTAPVEVGGRQIYK